MSPLFIALAAILTIAITLMAVAGAARHTKTLLISAFAVIGFALVSYITLGRPDLTGPNAAAPETLLARAITEMDESAAALLASTATTSDNWSELARQYLAVRAPKRAANALAEAAKLAPTASQRDVLLGNQAQVLIEADNRLVSAPARAIFAEILERNPDDLRALFFLGLAAEQAGDRGTTERYWSHILRIAPATSPLRDSLQARMDNIGNQPEMAGGDTSSNAKNVEAEVDIPIAGPQRDMIDGMVARLAERLQTQGGSIEEWAQLGKSYGVLGRWDEAVRAYDQALRIDPQNEKVNIARMKAVNRE